jgi:hypothetical protein
MVFDPAYIQILNFLTLPALCRFECYLNLTDSLISFINRHPTIIHLRIAPTEALVPPLAPGATISPTSSPYIFLPRLQYFWGNSQCISALTSATALRAAFVFWDVVDAAPQDAIAALERTSSSTMSVLGCRRRGWNLDLLDLISTWLPNIYALSVTNLLVVDAHPSAVSDRHFERGLYLFMLHSKAFLDAVKGFLARFTMLRCLRIGCVDLWKMGDVQCRMDDDFATVTSWGSVCPSLVECSLPRKDLSDSNLSF